jgi:hypothetical protein
MSAALAVLVADNVTAARTRMVLFFMVTSSAPAGELSFPIPARSLPILANDDRLIEWVIAVFRLNVSHHEIAIRGHA